MKIAVVTDTNSGITNEEAKELNINILPMPFTIDEKDFQPLFNELNKYIMGQLSDGID